MNFQKCSFHDGDNFERVKMFTQNAVTAFLDPWRAECVSACGDLGGTRALYSIREKMRNSEEGRLILEERPRFKQEYIDFKWLESLPDDTFGKAYWRFMAKYNFSPDERPLVKYIADMELAYILQRYKETHDCLHALLGYGIEVEEELAVKWFEMIQTGLPMTSYASLVAPLRLRPSAYLKLQFEYLPMIVKNAVKSKFYMNVYFEKYFEKNVNEMRKEMGIQI